MPPRLSPPLSPFTLLLHEVKTWNWLRAISWRPSLTELSHLGKFQLRWDWDASASSQLLLRCGTKLRSHPLHLCLPSEFLEGEQSVPFFWTKRGKGRKISVPVCVRSFLALSVPGLVFRSSCLNCRNSISLSVSSLNHPISFSSYFHQLGGSGIFLLRKSWWSFYFMVLYSYQSHFSMHHLIWPSKWLWEVLEHSYWYPHTKEEEVILLRKSENYKVSWWILPLCFLPWMIQIRPEHRIYPRPVVRCGRNGAGVNITG